MLRDYVKNFSLLFFCFCYFSRGLATLQDNLFVGPLVRLLRGDLVGECVNAYFRPCPPVRDWYRPVYPALIFYIFEIRPNLSFYQYL